GCGCKLAPETLLPLLARLPAQRDDERLLVDSHTSDDAGAYLLTEDLALVQTVDFFTPPVDDPYDFGRIAAANALSDVSAIGAGMGAADQAVPDVTDFVLLGQVPHVCRGGGVAAELNPDQLTAARGVQELLEAAAGVPAGARRNAEWAAGFTGFADGVAPWRR